MCAEGRDDLRREGTWTRYVYRESLQLTLWQLDPLRGSAYIPLPLWIQTKRAVINVTGTGDDCFKWAVLAGMHPVNAHTERMSKYAEHMGKYNNLSFNVYVWTTTKR